MATTSSTGDAGTTLALIALVICSAAIVAPVSAATKFLGGSPELSATVSGVNEFMPGDDATITILVKNTGVSTMKQLDLGTIDYEDLPTTAKFTTVSLASPGSAIIIKSDPQMIGSVPSGGTGVPVKFKAKISTNATTGEYQLPLTIGYKYPNDIRQEKADVFEYVYTDATTTIPVTIRIKPEVKIAVVESVPDTMSAGTEGYLNLKIRNDGPENGTKASVKLVRSGGSAIIPTDSTAFVGDFPSGGVVSCRFKIAASKDATNQIYPVDIIVTYTDREGNTVTSKAETIGIPVNGKTTFSVTSPVPLITAGTQASIEVTYRNNGNQTVYETQSRLTSHGDVTINGNVAYLGEIRPGESATARYDMQVGESNEPGEYTFDSTLRFRDALGNSQESDTVAVSVQVLPARAGTIAGIPTGAVIAAVILVLLAAGIVLMYQRRKKTQ